eukprot:SAG31_NODE_11391_length_1035_cov_233.152778_2_plen_42_part_01
MWPFAAHAANSLRSILAQSQEGDTDGVLQLIATEDTVTVLVD